MEPIKYQRMVVTPTPTTSFPEMVIITKTPKKYKWLEGKKFISEHKCKAYIDEYLREVSLLSITKVAKKDLAELGLEEF